MHPAVIAPTRIICVGNRYVAEDSLGNLVYDELKECSLPKDVALIDGGLAGMDLLPFLEGAQRVVFVDSLQGSTKEPALQQFTLEEIASGHVPLFDHSNSFHYLLCMLPFMLESPMPEVVILGTVGVPDPAIVRTAAHRALQIAGGYE